MGKVNVHDKIVIDTKKTNRKYGTQRMFSHKSPSK